MCKRHGQRLFDGQSTAKSFIEGCPFKANALSPLGKRESLAVECQESVSSRVARLLFFGRPAAVPRLVIAVVVREAVNAVLLGRSQPHVLKEQRKVVPPRADANPASAISLVPLCSRGVAAIEHIAPNSVFWSAFHSVRRWATDRIRFSHGDTSNLRVARTARQRQLLGRSHFSRMCSSGATCTCTSL